jgi:hypothetical protein
MNLMTYQLAEDGSSMAFRRNGPPPPAGQYEKVRPDTYANFTKRAKKLYDDAMNREASSSEPEHQLEFGK